MENIRTIEEVIAFLKSVNSHESKRKKICFFVGAGIDLSSGGKLFFELKYDYVKTYHDDIPKNISYEKLDELFNKYTASVSETEKAQLLERVALKSREISDSYKLLILLAEKKYLQAIVTTNFFDLLERTEKELNFSSFDVLSPGFVLPEDYYEKTDLHKAIYLKMHGDVKTRNITHLTDFEINHREYDVHFKKLLVHIIKNYQIVFIGYGGFDDKITEIFEDNIVNLNEVYWINISKPKESSKLATVLTENNKLYFCKATFDEFVLKFSCEFLLDEMLPDFNPVFIRELIKSKADLLCKKFINLDSNLIKRDIYNNLLKSLNDSNSVIINGRSGIGKSSFLKYYTMQANSTQNIIIPCEYQDSSVLGSLSALLGYQTDIPFSLLFSFCKWCNDNDILLTFIIDICGIYKNSEDSIKYINELFNFVTIINAFNNVKFIIAIDKSYYNFIHNEYANLFIEKVNILELGSFSESELKLLLSDISIQKNKLLSQDKMLLSEPYIWSIFKDLISGNANECFGSFGLLEKIEESILTSKKSREFGLDYLLIKECLMQIAENEISDIKNLTINKECVNYLAEYNLLIFKDKIPYFRYDIFKTYYIASFMYQDRSYANMYENRLNEYFLGNIEISDFTYNAYMYKYCKSGNVDNIEETLLTLNKFIQQSAISNRKILFTKKVLIELSNMFPDNYSKTITFLNLKKLDPILIKSICYSLQYIKNDDAAYIICDSFSAIEELRFTIFTFKTDRFYKRLISATKSEDIEKYFNKYRDIVYGKNDFEQLLSVIYLLMILDIGERNYEYLENKLHNDLKNLKIKISSHENLKSQISEEWLPILRKYAYNILFNSNDLEESFASIAYNQVIRNICKTVCEGTTITYAQYDALIDMSLDINNMWLFLLSNLVVMISMGNNKENTLVVLKDKATSLSIDIPVQQLDFYLSTLFMSLYIINPLDRMVFEEIFENLLYNFESKFFENPTKQRKATVRRFSEEFELVFEDGFNPLAFYCYTAPLNKNNLELYCKLAKSLENSGHGSEILKIVHALGQMISIYPSEGYETLLNLSHISQPIVRRGIVRILKENIVRYPYETEAFIDKCSLNFTCQEIEDIKSSISPQLENRTFEQLHWIRLFYSLEKNEYDYLKKMVNKILNSASLFEFISKIIV